MTTPIKPDFEDLSAVAHDETPILTKLQFPSPQRGRGVRGEGDRELVGICYPCHIQPNLLAFKAKAKERAMPPHPQPLSHVGEMGVEGSILPLIKWRLADASTRTRKFGARTLMAWLCMFLFGASPLALAQVKKTDKPAEQPGSVKPQRSVELHPQAQKVFAIKHGDVIAIARTLSIFPMTVPLQADRELRVIGVSAPVALLPAIEDTIRRLDVPPPTPQNVELTVYLLLGSDQEGLVATELDSVVKQLKATFGFKGFRTIDTLVVRSRDKQGANVKGIAQLASGTANSSAYQFTYNAASILSDEKGRSIRLDGLRFNATIMTRWDGAGIPVASEAAGFGTDVDVREGQKVVVGKAAVGSTNSALILVITAKVLE